MCGCKISITLTGCGTSLTCASPTLSHMRLKAEGDEEMTGRKVQKVFYARHFLARLAFGTVERRHLRVPSINAARLRCARERRTEKKDKSKRKHSSPPLEMEKSEAAPAWQQSSFWPAFILGLAF